MIIDGNSSDDSRIYSWQRLSDFDEDQLNYFFESISELKEKLLALLIQLPPSIDIVEGLDALVILLMAISIRPRGNRLIPATGIFHTLTKVSDMR